MKRTAALLLALLTLTALLPVLPAGAAEAYTAGVINADGVALRKGASSDTNRICRMAEGSEVEILQLNVNAEWHKVRYKNRTGYVNRLYVDLLTPEEAGETVATVVNVKEKVNIRSEASKHSELLGTAALGAQLSVVGERQDGWVAVNFNGKTGYILDDYASIANVGTKKQLKSLTVTGGTISPAFSPSVYGYVIVADGDEVDIKCSAHSGVSIRIGDNKTDHVVVQVKKGTSRTLRIKLAGKVTYTLYIVRDVLTVGTYNIKRGNGNLPAMGKMIMEQQPDIMGLQEVYRLSSASAKSGTVDNLLSLKTKHMKYSAFAQTVGYDSGGSYGLGILSAYKISNKSVTALSNGGEPRALQKVEVKIDGKTVSVYNTHFDYSSSTMREKQFGEILEVINADKNQYKIIFGDFNAKNKEYKAFGSGWTVVNTSNTKFYNYQAEKIEKNEIDNIIVTSNITVLNARMIENRYSDHMALFAYLRLN